MKTKISLIFSLLVIYSVLASCSLSRRVSESASPLTITLSLSAETFAKDEPIIARVVITNTSRDSVFVNARLLLNQRNNLGEIWFHIFDGDGKPPVFLSLIRAGPITKDHLRVLESGEELVAEYDLAEWYYLGRPGVYRISVQYHNQKSFEGISVWTGDLFSETTLIEIEE